jgi:hypothetical protein
MGDMGAGLGMLVVETIAKIRRAFFAQQKPIKAICREFRVSRKVVRKVNRLGCRLGHAAMSFSFASGSASRKVCIGVLPKHQRPWWGRCSLYNLAR